MRLDPRYVEARRVLLDALTALAPHASAVIVAGAQAVYLHTGDADIAVAPYTTDGDLALDPTLLGVDPQLEEAMTAAHFTLLSTPGGHTEPGTWVATATIENESVIVPVDLIVPKAMASDGSRGARLGVHGKRAARQVAGIEAVLVDHSPMTITALDRADTRSIVAEVAGSAALLVAKSFKLHDRIETGKPHRLDDKDASDVVRLMQTTSATDVGATMATLSYDPLAGATTLQGLQYLDDLFGRRGRPGVTMATRALRLGMPEAAIQTLCTSYVERLLEAARHTES
ncbi:MAG: hypothetical protein ACHP7H_00865 [Hyphomicrobiales bacterium]